MVLTVQHSTYLKRNSKSYVRRLFPCSSNFMQISSSAFLNIRIYINLDERKYQRRIYNFKLNFETGHLTEPGKVSVPEKRISWFDQSLISNHSALLVRWSTLRKVFRLWNRGEFHELRRAEYTGRRVDIRGNSINSGAINKFLYQWALNNTESLGNCGARLRPKSRKFRVWCWANQREMVGSLDPGCVA